MFCSFHGQSGSPVWLYNTSTGERFIRGILSSFAKSNTAGPGTFTLMSEVLPQAQVINASS